jgi:hypothetical protein
MYCTRKNRVLTAQSKQPHAAFLENLSGRH